MLPLLIVFQKIVPQPELKAQVTLECWYGVGKDTFTICSLSIVKVQHHVFFHDEVNHQGAVVMESSNM